MKDGTSLYREPKVTAPSRSITPAEQLEMIKRMEEKSVRKSFNDSREPSKQDLKVLVSIYKDSMCRGWEITTTFANFVCKNRVN